MKKYLILIIILLLICGCSHSNDVQLKDGSIQVICESKNLGDKVIITKSKIIANYDKNQKIMNYRTETVEQDVDKKTFNERKKMYDETYTNIENDEATYEYKVDKEKQTFTIITAYKNMDIDKFGKEEKERYKIKNLIQFYEKAKYNCKISGTSRKKVGL